MSGKLGIVINAAGFQLGWWACVLGAGWGYPLLGPLVITAFIAQQIYSRGTDGRRMLVIVLLTIAGTVLDSLMLLSGLVHYSAGYSSVTWIAPLWITAMWTGFALTVDSSLGFLRGRQILSAVSGAVFGPLAYLTAARFGAVTFGYGQEFTITMLALIWAAALTVIFNLPQWLSPEDSELSGCRLLPAESQGGEG